jgi:hypothetical protein
MGFQHERPRLLGVEEMTHDEWYKRCHRRWPEIRTTIKPKEEKMEEKDIKLNVHTVVNYGDGTNRVYVPISEAIRAGEEAKRIMEEDKIKEGDWVLYDHHVVQISSITSNNFVRVNGGYLYPLQKLTKITNPAHIKALTEIFEAMK